MLKGKEKKMEAKSMKKADREPKKPVSVKKTGAKKEARGSAKAEGKKTAGRRSIAPVSVPVNYTEDLVLYERNEPYISEVCIAKAVNSLGDIKLMHRYRMMVTRGKQLTTISRYGVLFVSVKEPSITSGSITLQFRKSASRARKPSDANPQIDGAL